MYTLAATSAQGASAYAVVTVNVRNNLSVLAGTAYSGNSNYGYAGYLVSCMYPNWAAIDGAGNIYVTDSDDEMVCKISPSGAVTVLASDGYRYFEEDSAASRSVSAGGSLASATSAHRAAQPARKSALAASRRAPYGLLSSLSRPAFNTRLNAATANSVTDAGMDDPEGIAVSSDGSTVYVADWSQSVIRKITIASDGSTSISLLAGTPYERSYQDGPAAQALFNYPYGLALDGNGNLYVADYYNYVIREISATGTVSTVAGMAGYEAHVDGPGATAEFGYLEGLAASSDGSTIYAAEESYDNSLGEWLYDIREVSTDSEGVVTVSTPAGSTQGYADGTGTAAQFSWWMGLTLGSDGKTLYVADEDNEVIRQVSFASDGTATVSTIAGSPGRYGNLDGVGANALFESPRGMVADASNNLYVVDDEYYALRKVALSNDQVSTFLLGTFGNTSGSSDGTGSTAAFDLPYALASDQNGNYYVADSLNSTVREIVAGAVTTLAGTSGMNGFADGTGAAALFDNPEGLAVDPTGTTLYVADTGNGAIRALDISSGAVTTLGGAAEFDYPESLAMGPDGNLWVADDGEVLQVDTSTGAVSTPLFTAAGSSGPSNPLYDINSLAIYTDSEGNSTLYAAYNCSIISVDLATNIYSPLVGSSVCGYQDGTGANALFYYVENLSVDSQGNLYAADSDNSVVRRITPAGVVTTVAGTYGNATNTTGPLPASVYLPIAVQVDATDNLLITTPNAVLTLVP
jgi:DNA-binding beta-propeller fold protein YncE